MDYMLTKKKKSSIIEIELSNIFSDSFLYGNFVPSGYKGTNNEKKMN